MIDSNMKSRPTFARLPWVAAASLRLCIAAAAVLAPFSALAQEEDVKNDARLEGYSTKVALDGGDSTALTWLLLVFLAMVALGVMFKSSKRTHLD
jgi:hypothetical protein